MMYKMKKRHVTLIEMMIVMFLIAMIIGVIAYNYQGSLDEGKAFKTKAGIEKLKTILVLRIAEDPDAAQDIDSKWRDYVKSSPLVKNADSLIKDGWGQEYTVHRINEEGEVEITSQKYEAYLRKHLQDGGTMFGKDKVSQ